MRKNNLIFTALLIAAVFIFAVLPLAAKGVQEESSGKDMGPITFFTDKPAWQDGWDAVFAAFEEKTGITVEMTGYTEIDTYVAAVKTGISSPQGPDMFTWWSDYKLQSLAKEGLLEELSDIYAGMPGKYNDGLMKSFSWDGGVYGAPSLVASWIMFYNLPVFEKYGLTEPKTWDEFIEVCRELKKNDITPIAFTIDGGWTSFFWFQQILASNYPQAYLDICGGEKSWQCKEVEDTFLLWKWMMDEGFFSDPGINLGEELPAMFAKGEVGMTYCGDWFTAFFDQVDLKGGEDYLIFPLPSYVSGRPKTVLYEAGPISISANGRHKEAAKQFIEFWLSDEGQLIFSKAMNFVSPNADVPGDFLDPVKKKVASDVFGDKDADLLVRFWEASLETMTMPACAAFDKFILNPDSYKDVMAELEKISTEAWEEYRSKN